MQIEREPSGDLCCRGITALHADTLMHIPEWLESDDSRVQARLLPKVYEEPEDEEQWRKFAVPELEHLFASRAEIVGKDLESLAQDGAVVARSTHLAGPQRMMNRPGGPADIGVDIFT